MYALHLLQAPIMAAAGPGSVSFTGRAGRATFAANTAAGDTAGAPAPEPTPAPAPAPAKKAASKPRLPGLDSLRFFLIAYIAVGHFVAFASKDPFILKLFSQVTCMCAAVRCRGFITAVAMRPSSNSMREVVRC
jgi:hypothetical protein